MGPESLNAYERIYNFYGFPLLVLAAVVFLAYKVITYMVKKFDPVLDVLIGYLIQMPKEQENQTKLLQEGLEVGKQALKVGHENGKKIDELRGSICVNFKARVEGQGG